MATRLLVAALLVAALLVAALLTAKALLFATAAPLVNVRVVTVDASPAPGAPAGSP